MTLELKSCTTTLHPRRRLQRYELDLYRSATAGEPLPQGGGSFGSRTMTTKQNTRRGEALVAGRPPNPPTMGFDSLRPCECEGPICLNGLGFSRRNSSLTTEEIPSIGIWSPTMPRRDLIAIPPAGCRRGTTPGRNPGASATAGSIPAPRTLGPEHEWQCTSPARSPVTVRVRLGPLSRATGPRIRRRPYTFGSSAGVAESVDAPASKPADHVMRVRPSPPVLWREPG